MTPNHGTIWRIAAPMIISNLSVPLLGIVDTAVVGHLNHADSLAAVAVGATIFSFLYLGFNFLRMTTTGVTAQATGRGDHAGVRIALWQGVWLSAAIAIALIVLQWPLRVIGLDLIHPGAAVRAKAAVYFNIRIWAAPAVLASYVVVGWCLGLGNARVPLVLMLAVNIINAVLDIVLVSGLGFDVAGVAFASVVAAYAGLALGLWLVRRSWRAHPAKVSMRQVFSPQALKRIVSLNGHLLVRTLCLMFGFGFFTAMGARLGTTILAANAVLLNLQNITSYALDGFAHAAETLTGQAVGRGNGPDLRRAMSLSLLWALGCALVFAVAFALGGPFFIHLMTGLQAVQAAAMTYLPWMVLAPVVAVWAFALDGVFVGTMRSRDMRNAMIGALMVYLLVWYSTRGLGNHGLWLAFICFMGARGVIMGWMYRRLERTGRLLGQ